MDAATDIEVKPESRPEDRVQNPERFTGHRVQLAVYEGPLDLLLYLVRAHRYDICDIPIAEITGEFVEFIKLMSELDLDYAGDFLVTAATLMQIKSRMLLPKHESENEDEMTDDSDADPRTALVERLLELQKFQGAADILRERRDERAHVFSRPAVLDPSVAAAQQAALETGEPAPEPDMGVMLRDVSTFDLLRALQKVLERQNERPVTTLRREPFTLAERAKEVFKRLAQGEATFGELCDDCQTRLEVVITFLSILELIARKRIAARQPEAFGEIYLNVQIAE
ncbi:MAG TPA: segregation/condensation protein A [Abditibacteriaceae bacterium]|jgi:segregation and condensation protein A